MFNIPPSKALRPYVKCYRIIENSGDLFRSQKVPTIGEEELIINYIDGVEWNNTLIPLEENPALCCATSTYTCEEVKSGLFIISFQPIGLQLLSSATQQNEKVLSPELEDLVKKLIQAQSNQERVTICNQFLEVVIKTQKEKQSPVMLHQVVRKIEASNGQLSLDELSGYFECTAKYLQNLFIRSYGMSVDQYSRSIRFKRILLSIQEKNDDFHSPINSLGLNGLLEGKQPA